MGKAIPTINLSGLNNPEKQPDITKTLMEAASEVGFFNISHHGVTKEEIDGMFRTLGDFFALPDSDKEQMPVDPDTYLGWEKNAEISAATGRADLKESIQMGYDQRGWGSDWPTEKVLPGMRERTLAFMDKCHALCSKILELFAAGLGLPSNAFAKVIDKSAKDCNCALRCMRYYDVTGRTFPEGYMRLSPHTDITCITLLFHRVGEPGLQVCPGREVTTDYAHGDTWYEAEPQEGCILVNIGDVLMYMSDDRLKSNFHRIPAPNADRYQGTKQTMAFFTNPNLDAVFQGPLGKYPPTTGANIARRMDMTWEHEDQEAVAAAPKEVPQKLVAVH